MKTDIDRQEMKVIMAYLAVCIIWGSTYLGMRIAVSAFPPEIFGGIRFITAGAIMLLFAWIKGHTFPKNSKEVMKISLIGLMLIFGSNGTVMWVEQWVYSGITTLILATTPLFMALIEIFMPGENKVGFMGWVGLLIGFGGVVLLIFSGSGTGGVDVVGGANLLIAVALLWSIGSTYSKHLNPSCSIIPNIGIQMLVGGSAQLTLGIVIGEASKIHFNLKAVWVMAYLILVGSLVGYSCYVYMLQKWPAAKAGTYAYVNPVVAVVLGAVVLGEPVTPGIVLSMVIILGGVIMVQISI